MAPRAKIYVDRASDLEPKRLRKTSFVHLSSSEHAWVSLSISEPLRDGVQYSMTLSEPLSADLTRPGRL